LNQETGVDQEAILAYLSDGTRLRTDNVRELVGAHDQASHVLTVNAENINSINRLSMFSISIIWIST
jgi:autophagy-related protein 11